MAKLIERRNFMRFKACMSIALSRIFGLTTTSQENHGEHSQAGPWKRMRDEYARTPNLEVIASKS